MFEHSIWQCGEEIRQLLAGKPSLRADPDLHDRILQVACNPCATRGRQSVVMLLGYKSCARCAGKLVEQIANTSTTGIVIDMLLKIRCAGNAAQVQSFVRHEQAWILKKAINQ